MINVIQIYPNKIIQSTRVVIITHDYLDFIPLITTYHPITQRFMATKIILDDALYKIMVIDPLDDGF